MTAITKDIVLQFVSDDDLSRIEDLTAQQWAEYLRLLTDYFAGDSAPDGWTFLIRTVMQRYGATPDQALVLAATRYELDRLID